MERIASEKVVDPGPRHAAAATGARKGRLPSVDDGNRHPLLCPPTPITVFPGSSQLHVAWVRMVDPLSPWTCSDEGERTNEALVKHISILPNIYAHACACFGCSRICINKFSSNSINRCSGTYFTRSRKVLILRGECRMCCANRHVDFSSQWTTQGKWLMRLSQRSRESNIGHCMSFW